MGKTIYYDSFQSLTQAQLADCVRLVERFFYETNQKQFSSYCRKNALLTMQHAKHSAVGYIASCKDEVIGMCSFNIGAIWTAENLAYGEIFYIDKGFRDKETADNLFYLCLDDLQKLGVAGVYLTSTGGFDDKGANARAFNMLCKRHGFTEMARSKVLIKDLTRLENCNNGIN